MPVSRESVVSVCCSDHPMLFHIPNENSIAWLRQYGIWTSAFWKSRILNNLWVVGGQVTPTQIRGRCWLQRMCFRNLLNRWWSICELAVAVRQVTDVMTQIFLLSDQENILTMASVVHNAWLRFFYPEHTGVFGPKTVYFTKKNRLLSQPLNRSMVFCLVRLPLCLTAHKRDLNIFFLAHRHVPICLMVMP